MFKHLGAVRLGSGSVGVLSMDGSMNACGQEELQLRTAE
jgi:hypothetical protein